jgi:hypothetical protein
LRDPVHTLADPFQRSGDPLSSSPISCIAHPLHPNGTLTVVVAGMS